MVAIDTNILVYAHREESPQHARAKAAIAELAEGDAPWALPVFVISEFMRVVTHPKYFPNPTPPLMALAVIESLVQSPLCRLISPGGSYWDAFREFVEDENVTGTNVHDVAIAAVCVEWGVDTILTEDKGFPKIDGLEIRRLK